MRYVLVLALIVLAALVGFHQGVKAERFEALKSAPIETTYDYIKAK